MNTSNNVNVAYEYLAVADSEVAKIAVVSLDRGDKLNGLTLEMLTAVSYTHLTLPTTPYV